MKLEWMYFVPKRHPHSGYFGLEKLGCVEAANAGWGRHFEQRKREKEEKIEATDHKKKTMGIVEPLPSKNHSRTIEKVRTVKSLVNFYIIGS